MTSWYEHLLLSTRQRRKVVAFEGTRILLLELLIEVDAHALGGAT
jgi:hypothetical protein